MMTLRKVKLTIFDKRKELSSEELNFNAIKIVNILNI